MNSDIEKERNASSVNVHKMKLFLGFEQFGDLDQYKKQLKISKLKFSNGIKKKFLIFFKNIKRRKNLKSNKTNTK
jgi:hypothetical protein